MSFITGTTLALTYSNDVVYGGGGASCRCRLMQLLLQVQLEPRGVMLGTLRPSCGYNDLLQTASKLPFSLDLTGSRTKSNRRLSNGQGSDR